MKTPLIFVSIAFVSIMEARQHEYSLNQAIALKKVSVQAESSGGHQGYCVNLQVINISGDSLIVDVEPGTKLNSVKDEHQDILLVKQIIIQLRRGEQKLVQVKGYCCQMKKQSPPPKSKFKVEENRDSNLVLVARFLSNNNFDIRSEQQAVWSISDGNPTGSISSENIASLRSLRSLVATLKNEPVPWYTYETKQHLYSNGAIAIFPIQLNGDLNYTSSEMVFASLIILDENQVLVNSIKSQWLQPGVEAKYKVDIGIHNLAKGKYTAKLIAKDKVLVAKEFEI